MSVSARRRAVINAAGITLSQGTAFLVGFLVLPFMIGRLGKEDFGLYQLVRSFLGYLPLLTLSTGPAIARYVTYAVGKNDLEAVNRFMSNGLAAVLGVASLLLAGGAVLSVYVPALGNFGPRVGEARWLVILLTVTMALGFVRALFNTPLYSRERLAEQAAIDVTTDLARGVCIVVLFLLLSPRLIWIGVAAVAGEILSTGIAVRCARRVFPWLRLAFSLMDRRSLVQLTAFSFYSTVSGLALAFYYSTDFILINWLFGSAGTRAIAVYTIGACWEPWFRSGFMPLIRIVIPRAILLSAQDRSGDMKRLLVMSVRYTTALVAPACVLISIYAEPILTLWMGNRFTREEFQVAAMIVPTLCIPLIFTVGISPTSAAFLAESRVAVPAWALVACAFAKVGLSLALGTPSRWGLVGVAAGTSITLTLNALVFQPLYLRRVCGLGARELFVSGFLPAWVLATLLGLVAGVLHVALPLRGIIPLFAALAFCLVFYLAGVYKYVLFPEDRERVINSFRGILRTRRGEPEAD